MDHTASAIATVSGKHRLHESFFMASVVCIGVVRALMARHMGTFDFKDAATSLQSHQMDLYVALPASVLDHALKNVVPEKLEIRIDKQPGGSGGDKAWPLQEMVANAVVPYFVKFYEDFRPFLSTSLGSDPKQWPEFWRFVRTVRNAASHAGVNINDPTFPPATWHKLTYGPDQNGRKIFGNDLSSADILLLMVEMDNELEKLGAPIFP